VQIAQLQEQIVTLEANRKEERFGWLAATGLLFTVVSFMAAGVMAGSFVALMYLALLLFFSKRWGLAEFWESVIFANRIIGKSKDKPAGELASEGRSDEEDQV
jgi:hypothetical protein